jgi:hypothetical protein
LKLTTVWRTAPGASGELVGTVEDEPMCMLITVPVSSHAWKNGSQ